LHLAGLFMKRYSSLTPTVYITNPTWSNHQQVFESLGFKVESIKYYDPKTKSLDFESYLLALKAAPLKSIIILHACAHNPTGFDPSPKQWQMVGKIMKERNLFPVFDSAYLGFTSGSVDQDAFPIRYFADKLGMEMFICISFSKNMGLYG
jgi:aspartate aminotransferase, cytoplasmic